MYIHFDTAVGATGRVVFDRKAERISNYLVMRLDENNNMTSFMTLGCNRDEFDSDDIEVIIKLFFDFIFILNFLLI